MLRAHGAERAITFGSSRLPAPSLPESHAGRPCSCDQRHRGARSCRSADDGQCDRRSWCCRVRESVLRNGQLRGEVYHGPVVFTIGHSTRSADQLLTLLREAGVTLVADVRAYPSSRRYPQFNRDAVAGWLGEAGIGYFHVPGLGGRRQPQAGSPNGGWQQSAFRGYADHMRSPEFQTALGELDAAARGQPTTVMCAEAVWWRCHRRLIADALVVRGWRVVHLGIGVRAVHELAPFAVVEHDGTITYPPPQPSLLDAGPYA